MSIALAMSSSVVAMVGWAAPARATSPVLVFDTARLLPGDGIVQGVSCTDAKDCTAVENNPKYPQASYLVETSGGWQAAIDQPSVYLTAVSCTAPTYCTEVGQGPSLDPPGIGNPMYATESAGTWSAATELPSPGGGGSFAGISCTGAMNCTAVGYDTSGNPMYATESAGTWGAVTELSAPAGGGGFGGVSCTDAKDCTAVGGDGAGQAIYATESAGTWGAVTVLADGGGFAAVSCTDARDCTAVGQTNASPAPPPDTGTLMYATESAGTWGAVTKPPAPTGWGEFNGVSCTDAKNCTAVGAGGGYPLYSTESAGVWGAPKALAGDGGFFYGVSCVSATDCTAVGWDSYQQLPIYAGTVLATAPRPPIIEKVRPGNRSVNVRWSAPSSDGGADITIYIANARRGTATLRCESTGTSCTVRGLMNGKSYAVSVVAINAAGTSASSAHKTVKPRR
jgi:Fibronectin type III domain